MTARRQHYVPQCYLKAFAVPLRKKKAQLLVFDRTTGKQFQTAVDNVAQERDFNRVDAEGYAPDVIEGGLATFEGELAPALARTIDQGRFQTKDDRDLVLNLIAILAVRTPAFREHIRQFHERVTKGMMDFALSSEKVWEGQLKKAQEKGHIEIGKEISFEEMKRFHEEDQYKVEVSRHYHLKMEMELIDTILPLLGGRRWLFLRASKESGGFITTDRPVCLTWSKPVGSGMFSPGFGVRDTEVLFPLSPRLAIAGGFENEYQEGARDLSDNLVAYVNGKLIHFAPRQVYARDFHFGYRFPDQEIRKASRLINDAYFLRQREDDEDPPSALEMM